MSIKLEITIASGSDTPRKVRKELQDGTQLTLADIGVIGKDPHGKALAESFPLIKTQNGRVIVILPAGAAGNAGKRTLQELRSAKILKQQNQIEYLELGDRPVTVDFVGTLVTCSKDAAASQPTATSAGKAPPAAKVPASKVAAPPTAAALEQEAWQRSKRNGLLIVCLLIAILSHGGAIAYLAMMDVPDEYYADASKIPERFVKLIVQEVEEEEEESGSGAELDAAPQEVAEEEEEAGDEGGGGDENTETAAPQQTREQIKEKVRSKGVLALITSKGGGGSISDVLGNSGLSGNLDEALSQVSGVGVAGAGVEIRGQRGGGGEGKADIGALAAGKGRKGGLGTKKKKTVVASIKADKFETSGTLSQEAIRSVVQANLKKIKFCYNKELGKNPELKGKVEVEFIIGSDGKVKKYKISSSTMKNDAVESCILKKIRRFRFPKPEKGEVSVVYPFVFTTAG